MDESDEPRSIRLGLVQIHIKSGKVGQDVPPFPFIKKDTKPTKIKYHS